MTRMAKRMTRVAAKAGVDMQMYPSSVRVCLTEGKARPSSPPSSVSLMAKVRSPEDTT